MKIVRLLSTVVTYLELRAAPPRLAQPPAAHADARVERVRNIPLSFYRYLYREVGRAHHWTSRNLADDALLSELRHPGIEVHVLTIGGAPAGWFELDAARKPGETRIVHFGLMPDFQGAGLARFLLGQSVDAAFATGARTVTLETNELDHPAALRLYREFGFTITGTRSVSTPAIDD
ncbi:MULTISPECIES: GNAT family N-acetyltransferase [unclassified Aureimonas]|uniref:GNAT family N-acetyltransferase n=1 Tax=unclassified Aureimonas TaxID=2615206 RepID=UPI000AB1ED39|nr:MULTISPECIES: GNAT family N-acetyltransferase [unclassified Aureimonas]